MTLWLLALAGGTFCRHWREPSREEYLLEARRALGAGRQDDAELALRRVLARYPHETEVRIGLGELARERGDWATVAAVLRDVPESDPQAAAVLLAEGDAWLKLDRAVQAEQCWLRALKLDPEYQLARYRLVYLYAIQLRREAWIERLWELYDRGQAGMREMLQLMIAGHIVWETHEPLEQMRRFAAADAADLASRRAIGLYLLRSGRTADAVRHLNELGQRNPDDVETWLLRVQAQLAAGDNERARELLARPPASAGEDYRYRKHRAALALEDRAYADAAAEYRHALACSPYDLESHHKLALALRLAGDADAAERHTRIAGTLARIERACHAMHNANGWMRDQGHSVVGYCEELMLVEEARGWVRVGVTHDPVDSFLLEADQRLAGLPVTSARRPPAGEALR